MKLQNTANLSSDQNPSQAQSIMSFTRGRTRWKNHRPHRRTFALNHIAALRIGICVWITSLLTTGVMAVKNQNIPISELCTKGETDNFLSNIPKQVDGAVIISRNERDVNCVVTFQTESVLGRFMIRFEDLKIDCNDKLVIYDGAHAIGKSMEDISCDKTGDSVGQNGVIFSQTNYVTLKYITDSWGTSENGFKMIITAFKAVTQQGCSKSFQCSSTNTCISDDLVCDTVHHCIDGSDERHSEFCRSLGLPGWIGLDRSAATAIVLGLILLSTALTTAYKLYYCKRSRDLRVDETRTANTGEYHVGHTDLNGVKNMNGIPGSGSTTGTSVSLGGYNNGGNHNGRHNGQYQVNGINGSGNGSGGAGNGSGVIHNGQYRPRVNGLNGLNGNGHGLNGLNGNGYGGSNMYLHNNGNGGATVESSNMLISTPPSGNAKRPAVGRGYNKSLCRNLQQLHFWLPL